FPKTSSPNNEADQVLVGGVPKYVIQLVKQVNFGPLESKRYFVMARSSDGGEQFAEVNEYYLVEENYQKVNSFKNYRCTSHNKFFEVNLYQKDPINKHHWRADVARPAGEIDL
ncbi:hypothetical protein K402DRAFT_321278, partial [Aulographum hederae CBS 113979]